MRRLFTNLKPIVEGGEVDDQTGFLKQLGAIEYTEQGKKFFPKEQ
jgi:hypothetical protein